VQARGALLTDDVHPEPRNRVCQMISARICPKNGERGGGRKHKAAYFQEKQGVRNIVTLNWGPEGKGFLGATLANSGTLIRLYFGRDFRGRRVGKDY